MWLVKQEAHDFSRGWMSQLNKAKPYGFRLGGSQSEANNFVALEFSIGYNRVCLSNLIIV
jgi:hypothetical protein